MKNYLSLLPAVLAILLTAFISVSADPYLGADTYFYTYDDSQKFELIDICYNKSDKSIEAYEKCVDEIHNWFATVKPEEIYDSSNQPAKIIDPSNGCYTFGSDLVPTLEGAEFDGWIVRTTPADFVLEIYFASTDGKFHEYGGTYYFWGDETEIGSTKCVEARNYRGYELWYWEAVTGESDIYPRACIELNTNWYYFDGYFANQITFVYEPIILSSEPETSLTVRCMDAETETELPYGEAVEALEPGTEYSAEAPEIEGYTLLNDARQTVTLSQTAEENLVTFWYAPIRETSYEVRFECEGEEEPLAEPVLREGELSGTTVRETAPEFEGCEPEGDPEQALTLGVDPANNILIFKYKRLYTDVTLRCVDENGEEIWRETLEHQPVGKPLEFEIPEIAGYEFDGDPEAEFIPVKEPEMEAAHDEDDDDEEEKPAVNCFILRYSASENGDIAADSFEDIYEAPAEEVFGN